METLLSVPSTLSPTVALAAPFLALVLLGGPAFGAGRVVRVDRRGGADYASLAEAAKVLEPGDTLRIEPGSGPYREVLFVARSGTEEAPIVVEGCGNLITGFEPLKGFRREGDRWVCPLPAKYPCVLAYRGERLRELPSDGRFDRYARLSEQRDALVLDPGVSTEGWEYSARYFVVKILDASHQTYRGLRASGALNDGFNLHGKGRGLRFSDIEGFDNLDEGFSAHDEIESSIEGGRFWNNENGLGNIGKSRTRVENVDCWDNLGWGVFMRECGLSARNLRSWGNGKRQIYFYNGATLDLENVTAYAPPYPSAPWATFFESRSYDAAKEALTISADSGLLRAKDLRSSPDLRPALSPPNSPHESLRH